MIMLLKQMMVMLTIIDDDVVEADDDVVVEADDGDLREWVAKPLFEHPATCSIVGHLAAKLIDQNKRYFWFVLSCCFCLSCFCFVYRLSTRLCKCFLFYCLVSDRSELFNSWTFGWRPSYSTERQIFCLYLLFNCLETGASFTSCQAIC